MLKTFINLSDTTFPIFFPLLLSFLFFLCFLLLFFGKDKIGLVKKKYIVVIIVGVGLVSSVTLVASTLPTLVTLSGKNAVVTFRVSLSIFADLTSDFWEAGGGRVSCFFFSAVAAVAYGEVKPPYLQLNPLRDW